MLQLGNWKMSQNLYFAYGSNLNLSDLNAWLRRKRLPEGLLKFHSLAWLPDFELAFTYQSTTRCGGVLDVRESVGSVVEGVLFEVRDGGWKALDSKEGVPNSYERIHTTVLASCGEAIPAVTYRVCPEQRQSFVPPAESYLSVVRQGLREWDICDRSFTDAAKNRKPEPLDSLFVYGTLLRGGNRFPLLSAHGIKCAVLAETMGQLADLGSFPALINLKTHSSAVHGEFVRLEHIEDALREIDEIEGFHGFGASGSLFRRARINVDVGDGRIRSAWTYCLAAADTQASIIPSGDWRVRSGQRERFIASLVETHVGNQEKVIAERIAGFLPFSFMDRQSAVDSLLPLTNALIDGRLSERRLAQASSCWTAIPRTH